MNQKTKSLVILFLFSLPVYLFSMLGIIVGMIIIIEDIQFYNAFLQGGLLNYILQGDGLFCLVTYMIHFIMLLLGTTFVLIPTRFSKIIFSFSLAVIFLSIASWLVYEHSSYRLVIINSAIALLYLIGVLRFTKKKNGSC